MTYNDTHFTRIHFKKEKRNEKDWHTKCKEKMVAFNVQCGNSFSVPTI